MPLCSCDSFLGINGENTMFKRYAIAASAVLALLLPLTRTMGATATTAPATNPKLPTLFIVGDSTVHNSGRGQCGWGDVIGDQFDLARINVVNRARGGRSSRTFI